MNDVIIKEAKSDQLLDIYYHERWKIMRKPFGMERYTEEYKKMMKGFT